MGNDRDGYEETEYMGEDGIKVDAWTSGRIRNVENKNWLGIVGATQRFGHCRRQKKKGLESKGHIVRMDHRMVAKKTFESKPEGRRRMETRR